eukprot:9462198-Pyramimonas_sp.AAC.1
MGWGGEVDGARAMRSIRASGRAREKLSRDGARESESGRGGEEEEEERRRAEGGGGKGREGI